MSLGIKTFLFLLLSLYFNFTKVNIFKLLGITIIFKSLFFLLYILDIGCDTNYINFIYLFFYGIVLSGIYISIAGA